MKLRRDQDAVGHAIWDAYQGGPGYEIVERDDGYVDNSGGPPIYLSVFRKWSEHERRAMREVRGRVLDIGCNAGRHALYLQERGHDVVGIDVSPLAIQTARARGLRDARVLAMTGISRRLGVFDTVLMMCNNFGLVENPRRAQWFLRRLRGLTSPGARILAASTDVYQTDRPEHLGYQRRNRRRGRMSGQIRLRIRYQQFTTPWFDYLLVSRKEMVAIVEGTGWTVARYHESGSPGYIAVLEKVDR